MISKMLFVQKCGKIRILRVCLENLLKFFGIPLELVVRHIGDVIVVFDFAPNRCRHAVKRSVSQGRYDPISFSLIVAENELVTGKLVEILVIPLLEFSDIVGAAYLRRNDMSQRNRGPIEDDHDTLIVFHFSFTSSFLCTQRKTRIPRHFRDSISVFDTLIGLF